MKPIESREYEPNPCIFCSIIEGSSSSIKVAENKGALSIMSLEGHPIVVTKKHIGQNIEGHTDQVASAFELAARITPAVKDAYHATGINIVANLGQDAGQEVMHFHVHVLPRRPGDRKMIFRPVGAYTRREMEGMANKIATSINK